jgi:hypothetical protein
MYDKKGFLGGAEGDVAISINPYCAKMQGLLRYARND